MTTTKTVAPLADLMARYADLDVVAVHWNKNTGGTITFGTCADYEAAVAKDGKTPDAGRLITRGFGHHRIRDHITRDLAVVEHLCWPHLPCWKDAR